MPLAPLGLLASVVTPLLAADFRGLDRQAVQDREARGRFARGAGLDSLSETLVSMGTMLPVGVSAADE